MTNSLLYIFKRPSTEHAEPFLESGYNGFQAQVHYTPNLAQEIKPSRNQRRINVDRVSISAGWHSCYEQRPGESGQNQPGQERPTLTFNADSYSQCFSQFDCKTDCFDGGVALKFAQLLLLADLRTAITFKAVCGTQTRMPQGFKLMDNQIQALSTPDNLVGGVLMCEPYLPLVGPKPPYKGGSYV